jgi:hypothetical protein
LYHNWLKPERRKSVMAQDKTQDPGVILAGLEAKKAALEALIASWRAAIAIGALGPVSDLPSLNGGGSESGPIELPEGAFRGRSVPEAIKLYLSAAKRKQTAKEIAAALREGGMESTAANFETVITGALHRLKGRDEVLRFKDGWALAEHYSEHLRARLADTKRHAPSKGAKRKRGRPRKNKQKAESKAESKPKTPTIVKSEKSVPERMRDALAGKELSAAEVAEAVGIKSQVAALLLGKLVSNKWAEKTGSGKFTAIKAA